MERLSQIERQWEKHARAKSPGLQVMPRYPTSDSLLLNQEALQRRTGSASGTVGVSQLNSQCETSEKVSKSLRVSLRYVCRMISALKPNLTRLCALGSFCLEGMFLRPTQLWIVCVP